MTGFKRGKMQMATTLYICGTFHIKEKNSVCNAPMQENNCLKAATNVQLTLAFKK
jgi:hypothetical protein